MATMTKKRKKLETDRADWLISVLTAVEAGDYKPMVKSYFNTGCLIYGIGEADSFRIGRSDAVQNQPPSSDNGLVLAADRGLIQLMECENVGPTHRQRLRVWWGHVAGGIPETLRRVTSVYLDPSNGRVADRRTDYRWIPPGAKGGNTWFPFPPNEAGHVNGYSRDDMGDLVPHYRTDAGGGGGQDWMCAAVPHFIRCFEVAQRQFWTVSLAAFRCETRMVVFTSAEGVKGFFDMREKGESGRRAALQHWVRQHARNVGGGDVVDVKRHLRGQTEFEWFGLTGRVHVPADQLTVT